MGPLLCLRLSCVRGILSDGSRSRRKSDLLSGGVVRPPLFLSGMVCVARAIQEVEQGLEERLEALGMELVQLEWAGSDRRPILRLRIDIENEPGTITIDDCARASRSLEPWLDEHSRVPEKYVLEVSSPGVERPLSRGRDFLRFTGSRVAVKGREVLCGRATRLEGELAGFEEDRDGGVILLRLNGGDEVRIPHKDVKGAHLVYEWKK